MSVTISTHVLDIASGRPAAGVSVRLEVHGPDGEWSHVGSRETDESGRVERFAGERPLESGLYRLTFDVGTYFKGQAAGTIFRLVPVVFEAADAGGRYHVPLVVSPYGYSTYRGS